MWGRNTLLAVVAATFIAGCTLDFDRFTAADGGGTGGSGGSGGQGGTGGGGTGGQGGTGGTDDDAGDIDAGPFTCDDDPCVAPATCDDSSGTGVCTCPSGYVGHADGRRCIDEDECMTGSLSCHVHADCINFDGGARCECMDGYNGDGVTTCEANVLCNQAQDNCDARATCMEIAGGIYCVCDAGFTGNGESCADVDECATDNGGCSTTPMVACNNAPGTHSCGACPSGYTGDGETCTDINECTNGTHNCDTSPGACTNSEGSFSCACPATYQGNGVGANGCYAVRQVTTGWGHTCARYENGMVKCWGHNSEGHLGIGDTNARGDGPNEMGPNLPAVNLGAGRTALDIAAGDHFTCALLDNYRVKCWGQDFVGQLGRGTNGQHVGDAANEVANTPPVDLGSASGAPLLASKIECGTGFACALLSSGPDTGAIKCWGLNAGGQLGIGDGTDPDDSGAWGDAPNEMGDVLQEVSLPFGAVRAMALGDVYTGPSHMCAISADRAVWCWGGNALGQLGAGTTEYAPWPSDVVNLGTNINAKDISAGLGHTCAILNNDTVKCWGMNAGGELGIGTTEDMGDEPNETGSNLPIVPLTRSVSAIEAGMRATCALLNDGTLRCWGNGGATEVSGTSTGQLGQSDTTTYGDEPGEVAALPAVALGTSEPVTQISMQFGHTCVVFRDGRVKCWGANNYGQLGLGDIAGARAAVGDEANEMGSMLPFVDLRP